MPGRVLNVVEPRTFNFTDVQGSASPLVVAAQHIDVSGAKTVDMLVRLHVDPTLAGITGAATITVGALYDAPTDEEPITTFVDSTAIGTVVLDSNDAPPFYEIKQLTSVGGLISIVVVGSQPASPVDLEGKISVDLVLRD